MANNFLKYNNCEIGKSLKENNSSEIIKKIIHESEKSKCKMIIPEDCIVSKGCNMSEVANSNAITEISVKNNNLRNLLVERIEDNNIIIMMGRKSKQYYQKNFSIQRLAKDINSVFNEVF